VIGVPLEFKFNVLARRLWSYDDDSQVSVSWTAPGSTSNLKVLLFEDVKNSREEPDLQKRVKALRPVFERVFRASPALALEVAGEMKAAWPELRGATASAWDLAHAMSGDASGDLGCLTHAAELSEAAKRGMVPASASQTGNTAAFETNPKQWLADMRALKGAAGVDKVIEVLSAKDGAQESFVTLIDESDLKRVASGTAEGGGVQWALLASHFSVDQTSTFLDALPASVNAGTNSIVMAARWKLVRTAPDKAMELLKAPNLSDDVRLSLFGALADSAPPGFAPAVEDFGGLTPVETAMLTCAALRGTRGSSGQAESLAANALAEAGNLGPGGSEVAERVGRYFLEVENQPATALRLGLSLPPGDLRDSFMTTVVTKWAKADVVGASAALAAPEGAVPDSAIASLIKEIHSDPEATFTWVMRIQDQALREKIIAGELKKLDRRDPVAAAQWTQALNTMSGLAKQP
jgi:hypothetical protein